MALSDVFRDWYRDTIAKTVTAETNPDTLMAAATVTGPFKTATTDQMASMRKFFLEKIQKAKKAQEAYEEQARQARIYEGALTILRNSMPGLTIHELTGVSFQNAIDAYKEQLRASVRVRAPRPEVVDVETPLQCLLHLEEIHEEVLTQRGLDLEVSGLRGRITKFLHQHGYKRCKVVGGTAYYRKVPIESAPAPVQPKPVARPRGKDERVVLSEAAKNDIITRVSSAKGPELKKVMKEIAEQYFPENKWPRKQIDRVLTGKH